VVVLFYRAYQVFLSIRQISIKKLNVLLMLICPNVLLIAYFVGLKIGIK